MYPIKLGLLIALLLISTSLSARVSGTRESSVASISVDALRNAVYQTEWSEDGVVKLNDGEYFKPFVKGGATGVSIKLDNMTFGDLNGDAVKDAAVIWDTSAGGSGTFYELAAVLNRNGKPKHVATAFLGDRIDIQTLSIEAGQIVLEMITQGPGDPLCCPTQILHNTYILKGSELVETSSEILGKMQTNGEGDVLADLFDIILHWREMIKAEPDDQIDWYSKQIQFNKKWFKRLKILEIALTAIIPLII